MESRSQRYSDIRSDEKELYREECEFDMKSRTNVEFNLSGARYENKNNSDNKNIALFRKNIFQTNQPLHIIKNKNDFNDLLKIISPPVLDIDNGAFGRNESYFQKDQGHWFFLIFKLLNDEEFISTLIQCNSSFAVNPNVHLIIDFEKNKLSKYNKALVKLIKFYKLQNHKYVKPISKELMNCILNENPKEITTLPKKLSDILYNSGFEYEIEHNVDFKNNIRLCLDMMSRVCAFILMHNKYTDRNIITTKQQLKTKQKIINKLYSVRNTIPLE